jgi:DNA-binding LytR/AlgR family response regulator
MQLNTVLKSYNAFLIHSLKHNKLTILLFSTATALGYLSLPYLERYHKSIKEKSNEVKESDLESESSDSDKKD